MANEGTGAATSAVAARQGPALREVPEAIQWHEGMLLSPQHFQQHSARQEGLLQYAALAQNPLSWGVRHLRLDTGVLPTGLFRVRQLEAVFPDGTPVWFDAAEESAETSLQTDLTAAPQGKALTVYVTLPVRTAASAQGDGARFRSLPGAAVVDENTGEGGLEIPRLRPRLGLWAGEAPPPRYCSFPLARVERRDEAFALTEYLPPPAGVDANSPLHEMCAGLVQRLRAKAMFLAERVRAPSVAALTPVVWESKRQIQNLVGGLPPLETMLATGNCPPYGLYLALCGLAGQVAGLADNLLPPVLPAYRHEEVRECFGTVRDFILRAVNEGISESYLAVPMTYQAGVFQIRFDSAWAARRLAVGIRRPAGATEKQMATWGQQCLIASEEWMPALREKRILGLRRQLIGPGDELTAGAGMVLFEITPDPSFLQNDRLLQLINNNGGPAGVTPAEVILYVKMLEV